MERHLTTLQPTPSSQLYINFTIHPSSTSLCPGSRVAATHFYSLRYCLSLLSPAFISPKALPTHSPLSVLLSSSPSPTTHNPQPSIFSSLSLSHLSFFLPTLSRKAIWRPRSQRSISLHFHLHLSLVIISLPSSHLAQQPRGP